MGIQRRPESGQHFISAPKVRSTRWRYEKTPLVGERRGLIAALAALFGRRPRPFAGSAIADRIDKGLGFSRQVLKHGRSPTTGSLLFESVSNQLREYTTEAYAKADNALDSIDDSLKQEAAWLDEARPEEILDTLEARIEAKRVGLHTDLLPLAQSLVDTRVRLEDFKHRYQLTDDVHWGKRFDMAVVGQVGVLLLIEFLANSVFQADTQATGLVGGVLVASLTSLATIILGVMFGMGRQRAGKQFRSGGWQGSLLGGLATLLSFIFVSSLSLIRIAGESGDLNPLEHARLQLMADPFAGLRAMLDLPAFAYTLCISFLIATVAWKYLDYGGSFPGGRKRHLAYLDAFDAFEDHYRDEIDEAKAIAREQNELLDSAPAFIASCKVPIQTLVADHENVIDQHRHDAEDINGAGRMFVAFVNEQAVPAGPDPVLLPSPATSDMMDGHKTLLAARHAAFKRDATDLCARDDVSQDTVALARERFNDVVEAKLADFGLERDAMLEKALDKYKADKAWRVEILALTESTAGHAPARSAPHLAVSAK